MARFDDKVVVVMGGATGIGAAAVRRLAQEGAHVFLGDINITGASALAADIGAMGGIVETYEMDQSSPASVESFMHAAKARFGAINHAFLNGADTSHETFTRDTDAVTIDLDVWDRTLTVNLRGFLLGVRFAIPIMLESGGGSIVCTSTEFSFRSDGTTPAYGISKAGVNQLVRHVAARYGREGIRCNGIAPGVVLTETALRLIHDEWKETVLKTVCGPRLGVPEDIAAEALHLLSDDAAYINGQIISVNGGTLFR